MFLPSTLNSVVVFQKKNVNPDRKKKVVENMEFTEALENIVNPYL